MRIKHAGKSIIQSSHADILILLSKMLWGFTGLEAKPQGYALLLNILAMRLCVYVCVC